jgi:glycerophosphoryl diester phosphodiesterase
MKILLPLLLLCCTPIRKISVPDLPAFDKQGHRGCRGLMPENTIQAMLKAVDLGVTTLEMDVSITADSQVILSHDPILNPEITTKPDGTYLTAEESKNGVLYKMNYEEIKCYDVGLKPYPKFPRQEKIAAIKPLLKEVFDDVEAYLSLVKKNPVFYNIETKTNPKNDGILHPDPETFVRLLMTVIQQKKMEKKVIIQSFDFRTLQIIHRDYPEIKTAALVEDREQLGLNGQLNKLGFTPTFYSPYFSLITPTLIRECHDKGIRILPWTVNEKSKIEELKKMGVDGIITDYPDLFN